MFSKHQLSPSSLRKKSFFSYEGSPQVNQQLPSRKYDELNKMKGLLNSQRIQLLFGDYGVELLLQEDNLRVSNLNSNGVMRTCAVVHFNLPVPDWLSETHSKIYNGGSIGQTIKENQFNLLKEDLFLGTSELPNFVKKKMETHETIAAVHAYKLMVSNPETSATVNYCTITEMHSPLYLTLGDLLQLSPTVMTQPNIITQTVQQCLQDLQQVDKMINNSQYKHGF